MKYGDIVDNTKITDNKLQQWGYNQLFEKAAFIENWHVGYHKLGADFGRAMSNSENITITKKIESSLENNKISTTIQI